MMKTFVAAGALLALGVACAAQASPKAAQEVSSNVGGLDAGAPRALPLSGGLDLRAGRDDSSVSLRAVAVDSIPSASPGVDRFRSLSFTLSAPLDTSSARTELASLSGFANASAFEVKLSNVDVHGRRHGFDPAAFKAICDRATAAASAAGEDPTGQSCASLVSAYDKSDLQAYKDLFWARDAHAWIYGAAGKVGYNRFDFNDAATLAKRSTAKAPWSASAYVAYYGRGAQRLYTLSYEHEQSYADADTQVVCPAGAPPTACVTGPLGGPVRTRKDLFSFEVRQRFEKLAMAGTVTYDAKHDIWGVEAPIYLIQDAGGAGLSGGVKFGWRSDDHDFRVGVFVSKAFSVLDF